MDQALSILTGLGVNKTIFLMFGVVVGFYFIMHFVALKPLTKLIVERDNRIAGRLEKSKKLSKESTELENNLSESLKESYKVASEVYAKTKAEANKEVAGILTKAREEAQAKIKAAREAASSNVKQELSKVSGEVPVLAKMVVEQLSGIQSSKASSKAPANPEA